MDRNSEEYQQMRDKALSQLRSGESLTGKDGAFGPLLKEFLEAALDGEMSSHLDDSERLKAISGMVVAANVSKPWPARLIS